MSKKEDRGRVPKYAITEKGLKKLIRNAVKKAGGSQTEWANSKGVTTSSVTAFIRKTQPAGLKLPAALGYRPQIIFIPVDKPLIATAYPQRNASAKPSGKTDTTREPVNKKGYKAPSKDELKKKLKKRKKGKA